MTENKLTEDSAGPRGSKAGSLSRGAADRFKLKKTHKRPMHSDEKVGFGILWYFAILIFLIILASNGVTIVADLLNKIPNDDDQAILVMFKFPAMLLGIVGFVIGLRKFRTGIAIFSLISGPLGFFIALCSEDKSPRV